MMGTPDYEETLGRIRRVLLSLGPVLSAGEAGEVADLLDHAELGEGLRALAWLIVEEKKVIPQPDIREIESLASHMGITGELPAALRQPRTDDE